MTRVAPAKVRKEAKLGLMLHKKWKRGGTAVGVARAVQLSSGKAVSDQTIKRMYSYFQRHQHDRLDKDGSDGSIPGRGYIAWLLWGGYSGRKWAESEYKKLQGKKKNPITKSVKQIKKDLANKNIYLIKVTLDDYRSEPWAQEMVTKEEDFEVVDNYTNSGEPIFKTSEYVLAVLPKKYMQDFEFCRQMQMEGKLEKLPFTAACRAWLDNDQPLDWFNEQIHDRGYIGKDEYLYLVKVNNPTREEIKAKKEYFIELAQKCGKRPLIKTKEGIDLTNYLSRDPAFKEKIKELCPEWFGSTHEESKAKKEYFIELAQKCGKRPHIKTKEGIDLTNYLSRDPAFKEKIKELCPEWFGSTHEESKAKKEYFIELAEKCGKRPSQKTKEGIDLTSYLSRHPAFKEKIKELCPEWFNMSPEELETKKEYFIELAEKCGERPSQKTKEGIILTSYLLRDPAFKEKIKELCPQWFRKSYRTKKQNPTKEEEVEATKEYLLELARECGKRPQKDTPLGKKLHKYLQTDRAFKQKIKELCPDWFIKSSGAREETITAMEMFLEMARNGEKRPSTSSKEPEEKKLGQLLTDLLATYPDFRKKVLEANRDWFASEERKQFLSEYKEENPLSLIARGFDERPASAYDREELKKGIKTELEHTDDAIIASKIAKDHLDEDPHYYSKLIEMESKMKNPITSSHERSEEYLPIVQKIVDKEFKGADVWIDEESADILVGTMAFDEDRSFDDVLIRIKTNGQIKEGESVDDSIRKTAHKLMKKIHMALAEYVTKKPNPVPAGVEYFLGNPLRNKYDDKKKKKDNSDKDRFQINIRMIERSILPYILLSEISKTSPQGISAMRLKDKAVERIERVFPSEEMGEETPFEFHASVLYPMLEYFESKKWIEKAKEKPYPVIAEKGLDTLKNWEEQVLKVKEFIELEKKPNPVPAGVDPEEFDDLVKKLKKRKDVDSPYALANWILKQKNPTAYEKLVKQLQAKGVDDPKALAAWIGRQKYGKEEFQRRAAAGRRKKSNPSSDIKKDFDEILKGKSHD
jgi:hypothetical protein